MVGGLAARCYGASRPLNDIDLYVPGSSWNQLQFELRDHIILGPIHHVDRHWNIIFMKVNYLGQQVELGDADHTWYFDHRSQRWVREQIRFSESVPIEYDGITLPVMPRTQLIAYKRRLGREVDRMDIRQIER